MTKYGEQLIKIDYKWGKMLTYETGTGKKSYAKSHKQKT